MSDKKAEQPASQPAPARNTSTIMNTSRRPIVLPTGQMLGTKTDHERKNQGAKMHCDKPYMIELTAEDRKKCESVKSFQALISSANPVLRFV